MHPEALEGCKVIIAKIEWQPTQKVKVNEMFWVYMLKCSDGSYYVGQTDSLERRVVAHQLGQYNCYTAIRRPVQLVFQQAFTSRTEAFAAERQIKGWCRKKKEALIDENWNELRKHAQKKAVQAEVFDKEAQNEQKNVYRNPEFNSESKNAKSLL